MYSPLSTLLNLDCHLLRNISGHMCVLIDLIMSNYFSVYLFLSNLADTQVKIVVSCYFPQPNKKCRQTSVYLFVYHEPSACVSITFSKLATKAFGI